MECRSRHAVSRVIVDQVQTNYYGIHDYGTILSKCDLAVDYEGSSLWADMFYIS